MKTKIKKRLPKRFIKKGQSDYVLTQYGSYINEDEYGMVQEKNANSARELEISGYTAVW